MEQSGILYEEIQSMYTVGLKNFLKILTGLLLLASIVCRAAFPDKRETFTGLMLAALLSGVISFLFTSWRLVTQIRTDGIYVRYPPMLQGYTVCLWEDIEQL